MNISMRTKKYLTFGMLIIICLFFISMNIHAQGANIVSQSKEPDKKGNGGILYQGAASQAWEVTGEAKVPIATDTDIEEAKANAIGKAKDDVLIKIAGFFINPDILIKEKDYILRVLQPKVAEIIEETSVTSEQKSNDGFYKVKIEAKVKKGVVESFLAKNLFDDRVIVVTSEKNSKKILKKNILNPELTKKIKTKGYTIIDYQSVKNSTVTKLMPAVQQGNKEAIKKIGMYYLADVVIVGVIEASFSERVQEIYSAHAKGQIKIHSVGRQRELAYVSKHDIKGFGANEEKAGINAVEKGSSLLVDEAMKGLPSRQAKNVKVIIKEVADYPSLQKAKKLLAGMPYVKDIKEGVKNLKSEEATFYVRTTKNVDYLAKQILELKRFVVVDVGKSEILTEARKLN